MRRLCPRCGKPVPMGRACPRCGRADNRKHGTRTREQERRRKADNPWRAEYGTSAYKAARQRVLAATGGRCASCGRRIADLRRGEWVMRSGAGGVHHVRALSEGGTSSTDNLVPLCSPCHNRIDADRRRGR